MKSESLCVEDVGLRVPDPIANPNGLSAMLEFET